MKNLSKRQLDFIHLLLNEDQYKPILYFSQKLNVSDKTLKKDLQDMRDFLAGYGVEIIGKTGRGILIDPGAKKNMEVLNHIRVNKEEIPKESVLARRMTILKKLLLHPNHMTSVQKLSEEFYVSKASVVNDLKYIEDWIAPFSLLLDKSFEGTKIAGEEIDIRKAIACLVDEFQKNEWNRESAQPLEKLTKLDKPTLDSLAELFDIDEILYIESILINLERENKIRIGEMYFVNLLTHILISMRRVREGRKIPPTGGQKNIRVDRIEQYRQAQDIAGMIREKYEIDIGETETYYVYQYLVSSRLEKEEETPPGSPESAQEIETALADFLSDVLLMDFSYEEELYNGLLLHIRPMLNRLQYNIQIRNPLLDEMKKNHPQLFGICQIIFRIMSKKYGLNEISDDEIAYITTYYQVVNMRLATNKNVLVVCHSGYGTSQLLTAKLQYEFPALRIVATLSSRELEALEELQGIGYIISTVPISEKKVPHIVISAILSERDVKTIRDAIFYNRDTHSAKAGEVVAELFARPGDWAVEIAGKREKIEQALRGNAIEEPTFQTFALTTRCTVHVDTRKALSNNRANRWHVNLLPGERIEISLAVRDEAAFKNILTFAYQLSIFPEKMDELLACESEDAFLTALYGGW